MRLAIAGMVVGAILAPMHSFASSVAVLGTDLLAASVVSSVVCGDVNGRRVGAVDLLAVISGTHSPTACLHSS
jgi:hypothetical protein